MATTIETTTKAAVLLTTTKITFLFKTIKIQKGKKQTHKKQWYELKLNYFNLYIFIASVFYVYAEI